MKKLKVKDIDLKISKGLTRSEIKKVIEGYGQPINTISQRFNEKDQPDLAVFYKTNSDFKQ